MQLCGGYRHRGPENARDRRGSVGGRALVRAPREVWGIGVRSVVGALQRRKPAAIEN